jgi:hypothetical protein
MRMKADLAGWQHSGRQNVRSKIFRWMEWQAKATHANEGSILLD